MFNNKSFDFDEFKRLYDAADGEPEFFIVFEDKSYDYVITKYANFVDFSRCCNNYEETSEILTFPSLEKLYESNLIDGINLKRDWSKIKKIYPIWGDATFEMYCEIVNIEYKGELERE